MFSSLDLVITIEGVFSLCAWLLSCSELTDHLSWNHPSVSITTSCLLDSLKWSKQCAVWVQTACVLACWAECSTEAGRRGDSSAQRSSAASHHPCTVWEKIKPFLFNWWIFVLLGTLSWLIYSNSATPEGENSFKYTSQHSAERRAKGRAPQPRCSPSLVTLGQGTSSALAFCWGAKVTLSFQCLLIAQSSSTGRKKGTQNLNRIVFAVFLNVSLEF